MLHRLRHETNNNLTSPFREIERKQKSNEISLFLHSIMQKNKTEKKIIRNVSVRRSNRFGGITVLPEQVTVKLLELSHLGRSSLSSFSSLGARVGVSTSCLLFLRRRDWSVLTTYDPGSGDFCTITAGALRSVTQTFSPGFSAGRTEARCHQL